MSSSVSTALVGWSGFVGQSLRLQTSFDDLYRSSNIHEIHGKCFELIVCAAAPAQKWIANRQPAADHERIARLMVDIDRVKTGTFVLISTVDVFREPVGVDESSTVDEGDLHAYGLNRRQLEKFVENRFKEHLIIRLPGLVGPGLRKNIIFDFLNQNNLHAIDNRSIFQFYPMVNLWYDIKTALSARLKIVHLTAEPISVRDVSCLGFNRPFGQVLPGPPVIYDMRTRYAEFFGGIGHYQYNRRESLQAIRAYAQSEPRTTKLEGAPSK